MLNIACAIVFAAGVAGFVLHMMPSMMAWFMVVCALLPGVFALITYLINRNYPITNEVKEQMQAAIDAEKA